jgi:hypothetical protein
LRRVWLKTISGLTTNATNTIAPTSTSSRCKYCCSFAKPSGDSSVLSSRPRMPSGAKPITKRTTLDTASAASLSIVRVCSLA